MYKQKGLSLVELMISLTLGIILMTGVVQMFLTSRVTYSTQQAISRIQESGRMAVDFLSQDIRMAGYMGCMSRVTNITNGLGSAAAGNYLYDFDIALEGYPSTAHPLTDLGSVQPVAESDVLVIRRAGSDNLPIVGATGQNANLDVAPNADGNCVGDGPLCTGDIAIVSDCTQGRIFQVTNLTNIGGGGTRIVHATATGHSPGNSDPQLGNQQFPPGAEVLSVNTIAYFVADSSFAPGVRSLWQQVGSNAPTELVEGVERMKLHYGRDTNNDCVPDTYQDESSVSGTQWQDVSAVRLNLLMQSLEPNVLPEPQSLAFFGEDLASGVVADRRMRQVFTNTIGIRSRMTDASGAGTCDD